MWTGNPPATGLGDEHAAEVVRVVDQGLVRGVAQSAGRGDGVEQPGDR
jgi:hypothetical protein